MVDGTGMMASVPTSMKLNKARRKTMIELDIGTIFRYDGILCKVVEAQSSSCRECDFRYDSCGIMLACKPEFRKDGKDVCFKYVKNEEDNNG